MKAISVQLELPVTSSDFLSDVTLNHYKGETRLAFKYIDDEIDKQFLLIIHDVYLFSFITDACSTPFSIENAYEQLVSLEKSDWIKNIYQQARVNEISIEENLSHFMIYIPDFGCCEFAAMSASYLIN